MTAPTLPETLARLAQLLPERVREVDLTEQWGMTMLEVYVRGDGDQLGWRGIYSMGEAGNHSFPEDLIWLETALRQECVARGWHWQVGIGRAEVGDWDRRRVTVSWCDLPGGTPAHALAVAVVRWLDSEKMGEPW
ncbi:hypothetical protein ACMT4L_16765 [Deinococcus sp. A31D244]|uniref:hypothetical protein n=1 Tax=Deinococcus sp. A31D244 TaxID=3397675 RepID=UPI0039E0C60D